MEMSTKFPQFTNFDNEFAQNINLWEQIYNSLEPQSYENVWPGKWNNLDILNRTIVISILRPDKVVQCI